MISSNFFLDAMTDMMDTMASSVYEGTQTCNEMFFKGMDVVVSGTNMCEVKHSAQDKAQADRELQNEQVKNLRLSSRLATLEGKLVDAKNDSIKVKMQNISLEAEIKELDRKMRHNQLELSAMAKLRSQLHQCELQNGELRAENVLLRKRIAAVEMSALAKAERDRAKRIEKTLITKQEATKAMERVEAKKQSTKNAKRKVSTTKPVEAKEVAETKVAATKPELKPLDKKQDISIDPVPIQKGDFARLKNVTRLQNTRNDA